MRRLDNLVYGIWENKLFLPFIALIIDTLFTIADGNSITYIIRLKLQERRRRLDGEARVGHRRGKGEIR